MGLCQYGQKRWQERRKKAEEILNYYYRNSNQKIQKPDEEKPLSGKVIIVDPGHGGDSTEDAVGPEGLRKRMSTGDWIGTLKLLKEAGAEAYATRTQDVYLSLSRRAELATNEILTF